MFSKHNCSILIADEFAAVSASKKSPWATLRDPAETAELVETVTHKLSLKSIKRHKTI